jgi:hypothetical protein
MPYFIYKISAGRKLTLARSFEDYRSARDTARSMRAEPGEGHSETVKIIFAKDANEAERLLATRRERRPSEDD